MNKFNLLALSVILTIFLSSCGFGSVSGPIVEETRNLDPYTKIEVGYAISVALTEGEPGKIIVETNESVMDDVDTYVVGEVLYLRHRDGIRFRKAPAVHILVPSSNLSSIEMSGASNVRVVEKDLVFNSKSVSFDLSGASSFEGTINVTTLEVDLSGASIIDVFGSAESLTIDGSGGAKFDGRRFTTGSLSTELSGASEAHINITKEITKANLSGASDLYYVGEDIIVNGTETSGTSNIKKVAKF